MEAGISGKPASKQQKHHFSSHLSTLAVRWSSSPPRFWFNKTHPTPAGSTTWGAASQQTRPPRWACADRSPHTASRSSCSQRGKDEWTSTLYSSSWEKGQDGITWLGIGSPRELAVNGWSPHVRVNNLTTYILLTEAAHITALILHFFYILNRFWCIVARNSPGFFAPSPGFLPRPSAKWWWWQSSEQMKRRGFCAEWSSGSSNSYRKGKTSR